MHGHFRWRTILVCAILFALFGTGWYFLHRFQIRTLNARFLEQATRDEAKGKLDRAARFYRLYLFRESDDAEARAKSGMLKEKMAEKLARNGTALRDALADYEVALASDKSAGGTLLDPATRKDICLRQATIYLKLGKADDGLDALKQLSSVDQANAEAQFLFGGFYGMKKEFAKAKESFWNVVKADPKKLNAYVVLAELLQSDAQKKGKSKETPEKKQPNNPAAMPADAIGVLNRLVEKNPQEYRAFLMRAGFVRSSAEGNGKADEGQVAKARESAIERDLAKARELAPDNAEVLLTSASYEAQRARKADSEKSRAVLLGEARTYLEHAAKKNPKDARILAAQVDLEVAEKHVGEAIGLVRSAVEITTREEKARLLWQLATLLIDDNQLEQAEIEAIAAIEKNDPATPYIPLLRGRILMRAGKWRAAAEKLEAGHTPLEAAGPSVVDTKLLILQTDLLLAECARKLDDSDNEVAVLRRAKRAAPASPAARLALTKSLLTAGDVDGASIECEQLRTLRASPEADALYARILLAKIAKSPPATRRWDDVNATLAKLADANPQIVELRLRLAEAAAAQGKLKEARTILENARDKQPKAIELWIALANLAALGNKSEATKILDQAQQKLGNHPMIIVSRLSLATTDGGPPPPDVLDRMETETDKLEPSMQAIPLRVLAASFEIAGKKEKAESLWLRLAKLDKGSLAGQEALFQFYLRTENREGLARTIDDIERVEGKGGPIGHYGEALISILAARRKDSRLSDSDRKILIVNAREHLSAAAKIRPNWPVISEMLASIAGDDESALKYLRDAFAKSLAEGSSNPKVARMLLAKLVENGMNSEVDDVLQKIQATGSMEPDIRKLGAEVWLFNQNADRALEMAKSLVAADAKDYTGFLLQGRILGTLGKYSEAEDSLLESIKLAGEVPDAWVILVQVQVRSGELGKAKATIERMKSKVPSDKLALALGQSYQSVGEKALAEEQIMKAVGDAQPGDWIALQAAADFYRATGSLDKAGPILMRIIELTTKAIIDSKTQAAAVAARRAARRNLALVLGSQRNPQKRSQALGLVEQNLKENQLNVDDQIVKGTLLGASAERREEAIEILKAAFSTRTPRPEQLFVLSSLYDLKDDWPASHNIMLQVLNTSAKSENLPGLIAVFIDKLLAHDEVAEASDWVRRLRALNPHSAMTLDRLSRFEAARNRPDEVLAAVKNYLENTDLEKKDSDTSDLAVRFAIASRILGNLADFFPKLRTKDRAFAKDAEKLLVPFAEKTGKPESLLSLAEFYGHADNLEECLKTCKRLLADLPAQKVLDVAVFAIASNPASPEQYKEVEGWINAGKQKGTDLDRWDVFAAVLMERQGKFDEAEVLYREARTKSPSSIVAANNLAFLIGLLGKKTDEALKLVDSAVAGSNRMAEVLDSRATILLAMKKPKEAESDLREALAQDRTATRLFHFALEEDLLKNSEKATLAFDEAIRRGLRIELLHPLERDSYRKLKDRVDSTKKKGG